MLSAECKTLLIRHFPSEISREERISFMKHFGAIDIKCLNSNYKKSSLIFARFDNRNIAEAVMKKLHQVEILGQLLSVEFARNNDAFPNIDKEKLRDDESKKIDDGTMERKLYDGFLAKLNGWTGGLKLGVPPPVHLKYVYPPPSRRVLARISYSLASVPKFYNQVLHLMNRMNLPSPFEDDFPIPRSLSDVMHTDVAVDTTDLIIQDHEEHSESEMESDEDEGMDEGQEDNAVSVGLKRSGDNKKKGGLLPAKKRLKLAKVTSVGKESFRGSRGGTGVGGLKVEEVFEGGGPGISLKKIEMKISKSSVEGEERVVGAQGVEVIISEGFPTMEPPPHSSEEVDESSKNQKDTEGEEVDGTAVITAQELAANRISPKDQHLLPVYKNYQPGLLSCRLYIKNLAKTVIARDLHFIYRRYLLEDFPEEQGTMFDIRLMQEGRMKGQAFVSLQSVSQAEMALKETNGFILKGKPMVVQFARSSKAKT